MEKHQIFQGQTVSKLSVNFVKLTISEPFKRIKIILSQLLSYLADLVYPRRWRPGSWSETARLALPQPRAHGTAGRTGGTAGGDSTGGCTGRVEGISAGIEARLEGNIEDTPGNNNLDNLDNVQCTEVRKWEMQTFVCFSESHSWLTDLNGNWVTVRPVQCDLTWLWLRNRGLKSLFNPHISHTLTLTHGLWQWVEETFFCVNKCTNLN